MASFEFVLLGLVDDNTPAPIWIDQEPQASASSLPPVTEDADNDNDVENPSPATTGDGGANGGDNNNEPETLGQSIRSFFVILMYMILAMTLGSLIAVCGLVILVFCIFPIFLLVSILLCANYCSGAEPLPFFHLLRYIFQGDDPDFNPSPAKTKAKKKRYRPRLIVRKLVRIEDRDDDDDNDDNNNDDDDDGHDGDPPENTAKNDNENDNHAEDDDDESSRVLIIDKDKHPPTPQSNTLQRKTKRPIEIRTEGKSFCFSAPLDASDDGPEEEEADEDASDNDDDENGGSENENDNENENENEATADDAPSGGDARDANGDGADASGDASGSDRDENRSSNTAAGAIPTEEGGIELTAMDRGAASAASGDGGDLETGDGENENETDVETDRDCHCDCDCTCSNSNSNSTGGPIVPLPDEEEAMTPKDLLMRKDDDDDERELREVTCDICMLEFEVGDEIAWSPNVLCNHSFHKECILEWLVRKPTCPVCRQDYV